MTEKEINNLILQEDLNDGYLPISGDFVRPLPFVSSNKIDWQVGVVRAIFESGVTSECSIHTNTGIR